MEASIGRPPIARDEKRVPFLRIPPFPGARGGSFRTAEAAPIEAGRLAEALRQYRVGGTFWGKQPQLPDRYLLAMSEEAAEAANGRSSPDPLVLWIRGDATDVHISDALLITGECDPWHMLHGASALIGDTDEDVRLVAWLLGVRQCDDGGTSSDIATPGDLLEDLAQSGFANPFTGESMNALEAAELCGFWRELIDSNRGLAGGAGFAFWKQSHVAPLLWGGIEPFRFLQSASEVRPDSLIAVWLTKTPDALLAELERKNCRLVEVEDGFLRSHGLGADCVPPLSIAVDRLGAYFDPSRPSELENLIQNGTFGEDLITRARSLRRTIVEAGIGKYGRGQDVLDRPAGDQRHILVPGQVEDDRSVQTGGCGLFSNLDLLARVRRHAPDAYVIYKPHPDVLAGHRRGEIPEAECLRYADKIAGDFALAPLIAMADEVHVNTSLAGFEALMRGKQVTTFGVPFYAGWGLTNDLGPVPSRRTAKRTIDELVAATLLLYPRYLDPDTGLPCPAETVVARLAADSPGNLSAVVGMRRLQGKFMRRLRSLVQ